MTIKSLTAFSTAVIMVASMGANVARAVEHASSTHSSATGADAALEHAIELIGSAQAHSSTTIPVVGDLSSTSIPDARELGDQIRDVADDIVSGTASTSDLGPTIKCDVLAPIGWPIPQYSTECPLGTTTPPGNPGTTTPPGNPGTTTPTTTPETPGGGNGTTTDDGVGGGGDSSSSSGGGGSSRRSSSGGNNDNDGEVLGAEVGGGGDIPGVPETGLGGQAPVVFMLLFSSFLAMILSGAYWYALSKRAKRESMA